MTLAILAVLRRCCFLPVWDELGINSGRACDVLSGELQSRFVHWSGRVGETWVLCSVLSYSWRGVCPPGCVCFKQGKSLRYKKLLESETRLFSCAAVNFWWESILVCALTLLLIVSCPVSVEDWNALFSKTLELGQFWDYRGRRVSYKLRKRGGASTAFSVWLLGCFSVLITG